MSTTTAKTPSGTSMFCNHIHILASFRIYSYDVRTWAIVNCHRSRTPNPFLWFLDLEELIRTN